MSEHRSDDHPAGPGPEGEDEIRDRSKEVHPSGPEEVQDAREHAERLHRKSDPSGDSAGTVPTRRQDATG